MMTLRSLPTGAITESMAIVGTAILALGSVATLVWSVVSLRRNNAVYAYRQVLVDEIKEALMQELMAPAYLAAFIHDGKIDYAALSQAVDDDSAWRYAAYKSVDYDTMVRQFWKPLPSFWPDHSFHQPKDRSTA